MNREVDWEARLAAYIADRMAARFAWGTQDCCRFTCGGLAVQGIIDPMAAVAPYDTERGAQRAIAALGGTLDAAATALAARAGFQEVKPAFAGRGCPVLLDIAFGPPPRGFARQPCLGLVGLDGTRAWFAAANGLVWRAVTDCRRAWRVE